MKYLAVMLSLALCAGACGPTADFRIVDVVAHTSAGIVQGIGTCGAEIDEPYRYLTVTLRQSGPADLRARVRILPQETFALTSDEAVWAYGTLQPAFNPDGASVDRTAVALVCCPVVEQASVATPLRARLIYHGGLPYERQSTNTLTAAALAELCHETSTETGL